MFSTHIKLIISVPISLLVIIMPLSLYILYGKPLYTPAEYWIHDMYTKKDIYSETIPGEKIIIVSGSNSLFGISSYVLQSKLQKNVLNLAVHAGLPLPFLTLLIDKYAKLGDIVIMPLEYIYYKRDDTIDKWESMQYTTWGKNIWYPLSKKQQFDIIRNEAPLYTTRLFYLAKSMPIKTANEVKNTPHHTMITDKAYRSEYSNMYGEFLVDSPPTEHIANKKEIAYMASPEVSPHFISHIQQLQAKLRNKGALLFLTYPVSIKNKLFDIETIKTQKALKALVSELTSKNIYFFGNPHYYNLSKEHFYDTNYHLNAYGSILRTLFLADDLTLTLKGEQSSQTPPSNEYLNKKISETNFFLQKFRNEKEKIKLKKD